MPHIAVVGRRAPKTRLLIAAVYTVLGIGAVTMIVPFWLMVSNSFTSNVDSHDFKLIPAYFVSQGALFRKYEESAYNEDSQLYNYATAADIGDFLDIKPPEGINQQRVADYLDWKASLPLDYTFTGHAYSVSKPRISLAGVELYHQFLVQRFGNDIKKLNQAYHDQFDYFDLQPRREEWHTRVFQPLEDARWQDQLAFKKGLSPRFSQPSPVEGVFREFLANEDFTTGKQASDPKLYAQRYGLPIRKLADIHLAERMPPGKNLGGDWLKFVRTQAPYHFVTMGRGAQAAFTAWLRETYHGDLDYLRIAYRGAFGGKPVSDWRDVLLSERYPWNGVAAADWGKFLEDEKGCPARYIRLDTPQIRYRSLLRDHFRTVGAVNSAYGTAYSSFEAAELPLAEADWVLMLREKGGIERDFMLRNYRDVLAYISIHGRALRNTLVLVTCVVLLTLTINPASAYALSRYRLPQTYKILLFFLATMAFPAEVTAIPNFLLMKQLHMLNTFWALILPGAANGFSIFLLKGFFDSLPRELYEAAEMDGATEAQMFLKICLPMSTPVLAVIGLGAFMGAYGSFLWAFLVCQDKNMWTLMVWLQQMQSWAPQSMVYAALVLAAIPTLIVFIFAQDIIMRGVIIPMEK